MPLTVAMSTALPDECSETLPDARVEAVAALERRDGRPQAGLGEVLERRRARGGRSGRSGCRRGRTGRSRCARRRARASRAAASAAAGSGRSRSPPLVAVAARSCRRRGRSRSTRAASSRRGSASGRSAGRRLPAGRISKSRCGALPWLGLADAAEDRAADHARALLAGGLQRDLLRVEAEGRARSSSCRFVVGRSCAPGVRAARGRRPRARRRMPGGRTGAP